MQKRRNWCVAEEDTTPFSGLSGSGHSLEGHMQGIKLAVVGRHTLHLPWNDILVGQLTSKFSPATFVHDYWSLCPRLVRDEGERRDENNCGGRDRETLRMEQQRRQRTAAREYIPAICVCVCHKAASFVQAHA